MESSQRQTNQIESNKNRIQSITLLKLFMFEVTFKNTIHLFNSFNYRFVNSCFFDNCLFRVGVQLVWFFTSDF